MTATLIGPGGSVTVANEVEVRNDQGNPVPVSGTVAVSNPTTNPETGLAKDATLVDVKRGLSDYETRLDYGSRSDGNPVRVGKALSGTATSANTWSIQTFEYDSQARLTRVSVSVGVWA